MVVEHPIAIMDKFKVVELYKTVSLIRHAGLKIAQVYEQDIMQTPVHRQTPSQGINQAWIL